MALWTVEKMAEELCISLRLARKLIADGTVPSFVLPEPSRARRVRSEDVMAWAVSRTSTTPNRQEAAVAP